MAATCAANEAICASGVWGVVFGEGVTKAWLSTSVVDKSGFGEVVGADTAATCADGFVLRYTSSATCIMLARSALVKL